MLSSKITDYLGLTFVPKLSFYSKGGLFFEKLYLLEVTFAPGKCEH